jgi:4-hydroxy-3-methylbut-2-en-1-yl diphosphate reductase
MKTRISKIKEVGFCYGVKRAIDILARSALENGSVECLGEVVHNPQVMQKLKSQGISVINSANDMRGNMVAISAHGVSPQVEARLVDAKLRLIDATCPTVKKVQKTVQRMAKSGYDIVIFGDAAHAEVKGLLGWAQGRAIATTYPEQVIIAFPKFHRIGIVSQTTQVPESYLRFVKEILDKALTGNTEITILDTICREVRRRQSLTQSLAAKSDLIVVVGGKNSANSRRLAELGSALTETHLIEKAIEIDPKWLAGKKKIGIASGTSTSQESIDEVFAKLQNLTK